MGLTPKKYKGLIGFNKLTPVLGEFDAKGNQVFDTERIGADYKKSISGKKIGTPLKNLTRKEICAIIIKQNYLCSVKPAMAKKRENTCQK